MHRRIPSFLFAVLVLVCTEVLWAFSQTAPDIHAQNQHVLQRFNIGRVPWKLNFPTTYPKDQTFQGGFFIPPAGGQDIGISIQAVIPPDTLTTPLETDPVNQRVGGNFSWYFTPQHLGERETHLGFKVCRWLVFNGSALPPTCLMYYITVYRT